MGPSVQNKVFLEVRLAEARRTVLKCVESYDYPNSVFAELEGFCVGLALSSLSDAALSGSQNEKVIGHLAQIFDRNPSEADRQNLQGLIYVVRECFAIGHCPFPSHVYDRNDDLEKNEASELVGETVLWVDGFFMAARALENDWSKILFKFDQSDRLLPLFAFVETEDGDSMLDLSQGDLATYRLAEMPNINNSIMYIYRLNKRK